MQCSKQCCRFERSRFLSIASRSSTMSTSCSSLLSPYLILLPLPFIPFDLLLFSFSLLLLISFLLIIWIPLAHVTVNRVSMR